MWIYRMSDMYVFRCRPALCTYLSCPLFSSFWSEGGAEVQEGHWSAVGPGPADSTGKKHAEDFVHYQIASNCNVETLHCKWVQLVLE